MLWAKILFDFLVWVILAFYSISLIFIFLYSLAQLHLVYHYLKRKKRKKEKSVWPVLEYPSVTIQLPVYNEKYVAERLIDAVARLDYPKDLLEIQVLDDSVDETVELIARKVKEWQQKGCHLQHIRRQLRTGFKAGALKFGLAQAKGEFIAIFDADFLPPSDFLLKTIPLFQEKEVGMVQTQWTFINKDTSLLTRLQAFGLEGHFTVEQAGRNEAGVFINFNGTGGIWRKTCIEDAGGWQADTLTEDLDLSYRAQLKGWKFVYQENVESPSELPPAVRAIKSQQYRWTKGAAENVRKNLWKVFLSGFSFKTKVHAFFHLMNSSVYLSIFLAGLLSIPLLLIKNFYFQQYALFFQLATFSMVSFLFLSFSYWVAWRIKTKETFLRSILKFVKIFLLFLSVCMGLSFYNALAVWEGYIGRKSPFIRTPKFNLYNNDQQWQNNIYLKTTFDFTTLVEVFSVIYFSLGIVLAFYFLDFGLFLFHLTLLAGNFLLLMHSYKERIRFSSKTA